MTRFVCSCATLVLSLLAVPSDARAQGGRASPVAPRSGVQTTLDAGYAQVGALRAVDSGLHFDARLAWRRLLEAGVRIGGRLTWATLSGGAHRVRPGLAPVMGWIGTGVDFDSNHNHWELGLRVEAGVSLDELGAELGTNGERSVVGLAAAASWERSFANLRLDVAGQIVRSAQVTSRAAQFRLGFEVRRGSTFGFLAGHALYTSDLGWSVSPEVGVRFPRRPHQLRVSLRGPVVASGTWATLVVQWWHSLEPARS